MASIKIHNQNQNAEGSGWWQSIDISGKDLNHTTIDWVEVEIFPRLWSSQDAGTAKLLDELGVLTPAFILDFEGAASTATSTNASIMLLGWVVHGPCTTHVTCPSLLLIQVMQTWGLNTASYCSFRGKAMASFSGSFCSVATAVGSGRLVTYLNGVESWPGWRTVWWWHGTRWRWSKAYRPAACACTGQREAFFTYTCCFLNLRSWNFKLQRHAFL